MFCQCCGSRLDEGALFCRSCGKATATAVPQAPATDPVRYLTRQLPILGVLWIVYSVFHVVIVSSMLLFARFFLPAIQTALQRSPEPVPFPFVQLMRLVYTLSFFYGVATGILGVFAGYGLLQRKLWGRVVALVAAFVCVLNLPFGTALGIYTLLVLFPDHAEREYGQLATLA